MSADKKRESLELTQKQWDKLNAVATRTKSLAAAGPNAGKPSWRKLIERVANGELRVG